MLRLARELGYTLSELSQRITKEELQIWAALFEIETQEQEEAARKSRRR
jgi:hypothetical protein